MRQRARRVKFARASRVAGAGAAICDRPPVCKTQLVTAVFASCNPERGQIVCLTGSVIVLLVADLAVVDANPSWRVEVGATGVVIVDR